VDSGNAVKDEEKQGGETGVQRGRIGARTNVEGFEIKPQDFFGGQNGIRIKKPERCKSGNRSRRRGEEEGVRGTFARRGEGG